MKPVASFSHAADQLPPPRPRYLTTAVACVGPLVIGAAISVSFLATNGFTSGQISDLNPRDASVLQQIRQTGVLIRNDQIPCTFKPHLIVSVRWNAQIRDCCVHSIGIRNVQIESIAKLVSQLSALKQIDMPDAPASERNRSARLFPGLEITSNR